MKKLLLYTLAIVVPLFAMAQQTDTIHNSADTLSLTAKSNKARISLSVSGDFEIYIDNEYKGTSSWSGDVEVGVHTFEARKEGYETTTIRRSVKPISELQTFELATPMPKWGAIKVKSFPTNAKVFIDNSYVGRTPLKMPMLAGNHKLDVHKKRWSNAYSAQSIYINEGQTAKEKAILDPSYGCELVIMGGPTISIGVGNYFGCLTFQGIYGFRFNQRWMLGLGIALATEWGSHIRNGEKCDPYSNFLPRRFFSGPIGIYLQRDFINPCEACTPFLALSAGYDFAIQCTITHQNLTKVYKDGRWQDVYIDHCSRQYKSTGPYCNAQFGIRLGDPSFRDVQHQISMGYQYCTAPYALYGYDRGGDHCLLGPIENIGIHQITIHYTVCFSLKIK